MNEVNLRTCTAGELASLYILAMRGIVKLNPAEIQDHLESLVGDLLTIDAIRQVRTTMDAI